MNSRYGSPGAPCSRTQASKASHVGRWVRSYSARNALPLGSIVRAAGRNRAAGCPGPRISSGLHETIRTYGASGADEGREGDDVVLDDDVRSLPIDDLAELRLAVPGAVDERLPGRLHERRELLDRRLAEFRATCRG